MPKTHCAPASPCWACSRISSMLIWDCFIKKMFSNYSSRCGFSFVYRFLLICCLLLQKRDSRTILMMLNPVLVNSSKRNLRTLQLSRFSDNKDLELNNGRILASVIFSIKGKANANNIKIAIRLILSIKV